MGKQTFKYKSFEGSMEISLEDGCLYGHVMGIKDLVLYNAQTVPELKMQFFEAVEQYLADCEKLEREPT